MSEELQAAREAYLDVLSRPDEEYVFVDHYGNKQNRWVKISRREYDALVAMHDKLLPDVSTLFRYDDKV